METMYKLTTIYKLIKLGLTFYNGRPQPLRNAKFVSFDEHFQSI